MTPLGHMIPVFFFRDGLERPHERAHAYHAENKRPHVAFMSCLSCIFSTHVMPLIPRYSYISCLLHIMPLMPLMLLLSYRSCQRSCQFMSCCSCQLMFWTHASSFHASSCHVIPRISKFMVAHAKIHVISCQNSWLPMPKLMFPYVMPIYAIFHGRSYHVPLAGSCCSCGASSCNSWHKFCSCQFMSCHFHANFFGLLMLLLPGADQLMCGSCHPRYQVFSSFLAHAMHLES